MSRIPTTSVPVSRYRSFVTGSLRASGANASEARAVTSHLLDSDLLGDHGHGVARLPSIIRSVSSGGSRGGRWVADGTMLQFEGDSAIGYHAVAEGVARVDRALEQSAAVVARIGGTSHIGRLGYYTRWLALRGRFAFAATQSRRWMAAPGETNALLGSTALSVAMPTSGPPLVVDLSPMQVSASATRLAAILGCELPDGAAFDARGRPTRAPTDVLAGGAMAPAAGGKGFALGVLAATFSTLAGGLSVPDGDHGYGTFVVGAVPSTLGDAARWAAVEDLFARITCAGARVPGSRHTVSRVADDHVRMPRVVWECVAGDRPHVATRGHQN